MYGFGGWKVMVIVKVWVYNMGIDLGDSGGEYRVYMVPFIIVVIEIDRR